MNNGHDVIRAREGDPAAFARLVTRHGPVAERFARLWLADAAAAEDAVQDALLDAYLHLDQLRSPAAFPGWLRRIVLKHCDRHRRKLRPTGEGEPVAQLDDELGESLRGLRAAIDGLPPHERDAVALHYLGERSQAEVAETLGVSLAAVKKRLQRARERLERDPEGAAAALPAASDRVALFLALRSGDVTAVDVVLDRAPYLLDAPEAWTVDEALAGRFPLAHHHTPLVLAAQRGDLPVVRRLLARGADVNRRCGCAGGDTPLLAAALHGRTEVARALLEAGADVSLSNRKGFTALHLAEGRGSEALAERLRSAGAQPVPSLDGFTPEALAHAHQSLANGVRARAVDQGRDRSIPTGIRAVDAYVPLRTGMLMRVHGAAETGLMVLLSELSLRLGWLGLPVTWVSWLPYPWYRGELETIAAGAGDVAEVRCDAGLAPVQAEGRAVVVFSQLGHEGEALAYAVTLAERAALVILVDPWLGVTSGRPKPELTAPFDALLVTDPERAARGIYPAVDVEASGSRADPELAPFGDEDGFMRQPFAAYVHETGWLPEDGVQGELRAAELLRP